MLWNFVVALALAIGLGTLISLDPGYALFSYHHWVIEMPLWVSAVFFILLVALTLLVLWTLHSIASGSTKVKIWWKHYREKTARLQTYRGLLELAEGHWDKAERYLNQGATHSDTPLINYLSAATAAAENGATERCNHYLQLAFESNPGAEVAVRLTQAQLQLQQGEVEQSIATVERLYQENPKNSKNPKALRLLCTLYEATHNWNALLALLPMLRKQAILSQNALIHLEQKLYPALLPQYATLGLKPLLAFWNSSPASVHTDPTIICTVARLFVNSSGIDEAETLIRTTLKKQWHKDLILAYGVIPGHLPNKQLSFAESLLPTYSNDPALFLTVGRLCLINKLWGKARQYLERSLSILPMPETYAELGQLMEQLGLTAQKEEYFKKGLLLVTQPLLASPMPLENIEITQDLALAEKD